MWPRLLFADWWVPLLAVMSHFSVLGTRINEILDVSTSKKLKHMYYIELTNKATWVWGHRNLWDIRKHDTYQKNGIFSKICFGGGCLTVTIYPFQLWKEIHVIARTPYSILPIILCCFSTPSHVTTEPEPSQATALALAQCILGKFLGVGCHCFPPPLDVPTFSARCPHVQRRERPLVAEG
jgi:hypothetical protein